VEDIGIVLGQAIREALGDKQGIRRYGQATVPMDETLASVATDLSGRPYLVYNVGLPKVKIGEFDVELAREFFQALVNNLGANLHINVMYGDNVHHILEACFKATARALDLATQLDPRIEGVLSTKGKL
jgi:imidazoleglycerol-phosphate dehydratase